MDKKIVCLKTVEHSSDHQDEKIKTAPQVMSPGISVLFERFWSAGMVKHNRKKSLSLFTELIKKQHQPEKFTQFLITDIGNRLASGQLGFNSMNPATYLDDERWRDEIKPNAIARAPTTSGNETRRPRSTREMTIEQELSDSSWVASSSP